MTSDQYDREGQELYQRGEYELALGMFREGLTRFPRDPDLQLGCAMAHIQLGDYVQACELLEGLRRRGDRSSDVLQGLAEACLCLGKKSRAMEFVEEALARERDAEALTGLALILYRHNQFKEAARCYQRAADVSPGYAPAHLGYGVCCHRLGNPRAAVEALKRAVAADPEYWEAYSYLGNLLYDMRRRGEAKALLDKIPVDKLWDPAAMKRLARLCTGKQDREKLRAVQLRQREVERILLESRQRGLLDELSARLDRELPRRQPRGEDSFWNGKASSPAAVELEEVLRRMFEAPCAFEEGKRPRLARFDKALCERYLSCLTRFLNQQRRRLLELKSRGAEARRQVERADAASLLFYGAEVIREMRKRFKDRIIDRALITRLSNTLQRFRAHAASSARTLSAWTQAVDALG